MRTMDLGVVTWDCAHSTAAGMLCHAMVALQVLGRGRLVDVGDRCHPVLRHRRFQGKKSGVLARGSRNGVPKMGKFSRNGYLGGGSSNGGYQVRSPRKGLPEMRFQD